MGYEITSNCPIECPGFEKANTCSTYVFNTYAGDRDDTALITCYPVNYLIRKEKEHENMVCMG